MATTSKKRIPWIRLNSDYINDPKLKIGRCRAVWPWVLAVLKKWKNCAPHEELHYQVAALDLDLPAEVTGPQITGLVSVGLLIDDKNGNYFTPNWEKYQSEKRTNRRNTSRGSADQGRKTDMIPGSRTESADDPNKGAKTEPAGEDPRILDEHGEESRLSSDPTMLTVNRTKDHDHHSDQDPQKGAAPALASPWGWREKFVFQGRERWTAGSVEDAFAKLWPRERMTKQIRGFAREISTTDPDLLDRAFELISPDCTEAGDEYPRCYALKKALSIVRRQPVPQKAPEQLFAESTAASLGRLTLGDDRSRRERQTLAEEFLMAEERPPANILPAIVLSYTERGLAIPPLFADS